MPIFSIQKLRRIFTNTRYSKPASLYPPVTLGLFGFQIPTASNEPLAGSDGTPIPYFFILQVIVGLPTTLWLYKCAMMVIFQRKIIYLPSVPLGSRNEQLNQKDPNLSGLDYQEVTIKSSQPTRWSRRTVELKGIQMRCKSDKALQTKNRVIIVYLQGNAGTPPLRLPLFQKLLSLSKSASPELDITILAVAPRNFWLSTRSAPTQKAFISDYTSVLRYAQANYPDDKLVLYGHSLGGSIAIHVLSEAVKRKGKRIDGLILENPLPSIPWMVQSLYPQKWLPYHYLGGLAFDRWDTFPILAKQLIEPERILWIRSKNDEIVPRSNKQGEGVEGMYDLAGGKFIELDALHDNAYRERRWKLEIREFLSKLTLQSNP